MYEHKESVDKSVLDKYGTLVPEEFVNIWRTHGFSTLIDGYLKIINPDDYMPVLKDTYINHKGTIPLLASGLCDLFVWENGYLVQINYRTHEVMSVMKGLHFFERFMSSEDWVQNNLKPDLFFKACDKYGKPQFDEGFGFVPILAMGGVEDVAHMDKVKIREHILLISQLSGPIEH